MEHKYEISEDLFLSIIHSLQDFKNNTDDSESPDYMSDGEWLDVFHDLCKKIVMEVLR